MTIKAIIWDYDGTLVDTRQKNLNVTKLIISEITGEPCEKIPALTSLKNYEKASNGASNWRELYQKEFGFNEKQTNYAGPLWTKYQLIDTTPVKFYGGIEETISALGNYPHGVVSQNSSQAIEENLKKYGLLKFFDQITGYEEVAMENQKPHPEGLLKCMSQITELNDKEQIVYIGDHQTDVHCAYNVNKALNRKAVICIGAMYEKSDMVNGWKFKPDYIAYHPEDILKVIEEVNGSKTK